MNVLFFTISATMHYAIKLFKKKRPLIIAIFICSTLPLVLSHFLLNNSFFWVLLNKAFVYDQRYQIQTKFLPTPEPTMNRLIVGDFKFVEEMKRRDSDKKKSIFIVINQFDIFDIEAFFRATSKAQNSGNMKICELVIQILPAFSLWMAGLGPAQKIPGVEIAYGDSFKIRNIYQALEIISLAVQAEQTPKAWFSESARINKFYGQATIADQNGRNWHSVFSNTKNISGSIIGLLTIDEEIRVRYPDMITKTIELLDKETLDSSNFSWRNLENFELEEAAC